LRLLATFGTVFVIDVYDRASAHAFRRERKTETDTERKREREIEVKEKKSTEVETFKDTTKRKSRRDRGVGEKGVVRSV